MRKLLGRKHRTRFYVCLFAALGLLAFGFFNESGTSSSASPNCGGQELAGTWLNTAKPDGSDVLSAHVSIPCTGPAAAAGLAGPSLMPKIELQLSVRCMHVLTCDWQSVPVNWTTPQKRGDTPILSAHYDQDRFDRQVTLEPAEIGKLRLTLTSRLKGLAVAPVKSVYMLERQKS